MGQTPKAQKETLQVQQTRQTTQGGFVYLRFSMHMQCGPVIICRSSEKLFFIHFHMVADQNVGK